MQPTLYDDVPEGVLALGLPYTIEIDVIIDYLEVSIDLSQVCFAVLDLSKLFYEVFFVCALILRLGLPMF